MHPLTRVFPAAYLPLIAGLAATLVLLIWVGLVAAADSVPSGPRRPWPLLPIDSAAQSRSTVRTRVDSDQSVVIGRFVSEPRSGMN